MNLIGILLLVVFVISAILLILLVLVQNEDGDSLGGIFAGGSSSAFGSRSGNVLTRATYILGAIFIITSFSLAMVNRTSATAALENEARAVESAESGTWWQGDAPAAPDVAPAPEASAAPAAN